MDSVWCLPVVIWNVYAWLRWVLIRLSCVQHWDTEIGESQGVAPPGSVITKETSIGERKADNDLCPLWDTEIGVWSPRRHIEEREKQTMTKPNWISIWECTPQLMQWQKADLLYSLLISLLGSLCVVSVIRRSFICCSLSDQLVASLSIFWQLISQEGTTLIIDCKSECLGNKHKASVENSMLSLEHWNFERVEVCWTNMWVVLNMSMM